MSKIVVKEIIKSPFADDREKGKKLRKEIEKLLESGKSSIVLNFSSIETITMSFNDEVFRKLPDKWKKSKFFIFEGLTPEKVSEIKKLLGPSRIELKLKKLKVSGYKNLVDFEWDNIKDFNAVFGPNSSGKSTIIESLDLLISAHTGDLSNLFKDLYMKFLTHPKSIVSSGKENINIEAEFEYNNLKLQFTLTITWTSDEKWMCVGSLSSDSREIYTFYQIEDENINYQGNYEDWQDIFERIKIVKLKPDLLKVPSPKFERKLRKDGGNLASFLNYLKEKFPEKYRNVLYGIKAYVAEIYDIKIEEFQFENKTFVRLLFEDSKGWHPASSMSDGTLRILAFLSFINHPQTDIIVIDEPENGFHPGRLKWWIESLIENTQDQKLQVVLMTHSPIIAEITPREFWWVTSVSDEGSRIERVPDFVKEVQEIL